MFPSIRQRLMILTAVVVGALVWIRAGDFLLAPDGGSGFSLTHASSGLATAILVMVALGIPALVLGVMTSAQGNLLSGIFAVAAALCVVAWRGGPIDGWLWQVQAADDLPGRYNSLILETAIWQAGVVIMLMVIQFLRSPMRSRFPALAFEDHLGVDTAIRFPQLQALGSGLICAAVAGVLSVVLIRDSSSAQVIGGLLFAFLLGGVVSHAILPHGNPVGVLFSPAVVAITAYGWVLMQYDTAEQFFSAWHNDQLAGPALALPIYYASAALAGAAAGVGLGQVFDATKSEPASA